MKKVKVILVTNEIDNVFVAINATVSDIARACLAQTKQKMLFIKSSEIIAA